MYEVFEEAVFSVQVETRIPRLNNVAIQAFFPDRLCPVELVSLSSKSFEYRTGTLSSLGEKTLFVEIYRKNAFEKIRLLERRREELLLLIARFEQLIDQVPFWRRHLERIIRSLSRLLERIERRIERLSTPLAEASKTVTVRDSEAPVFEPMDDAIVEATGPLTVVALPAPAVRDAYDPDPVVTSDAPDAFPPGVTPVTFTATDSSGNASTLTIDVEITDTTPPAISGWGDVEKEAAAVFTPVDLSGVTAADLVDGTVPVENDAPERGFPVGETSVRLWASDSRGNTAEEEITVRIVDTTPPVIDAGEDIAVEATGEYTLVDLPVPEVFDLADPAPSVSDDASAGGFPLGETVVTFTATDASGNSASDSIVVAVAGIPAPRLRFREPSDGERVLDGVPDQIVLEAAEECTVLSGKLYANGTVIRELTASDFSASPGEPLLFSLPYTFYADSGLYRLQAEIETAGGTERAEIDVIAVDYVSPVPVSIREAPVTNQRNVHLEFSTIGLTHMRFGHSVDLGAYAWVPVASPVSYTLDPRDGEQPVFAEFIHESGIETGVSYAVVELDRTPPGRIADLSVFMLEEGAVRLTWSPVENEDLAYYEVFWNGGSGSIDYAAPLSTALDTSWTSEVLAPGTYSFAVRAVDRAGNPGEWSPAASCEVSGPGEYTVILPRNETVFDGSLPVEWSVPDTLDESAYRFEIDYRDYGAPDIRVFDVPFRDTAIAGSASFDVSEEQWHLATLDSYDGDFSGYGTDGRKYENGVPVPGDVADWFTECGAFPQRGVLVCADGVLSLFALEDSRLELWKRWEEAPQVLVQDAAAYSNGVIVCRVSDGGAIRPGKLDFMRNAAGHFEMVSGFDGLATLSGSRGASAPWFVFDGTVHRLDDGASFEVGVPATLVGEDLYFVKDNVLYAAYGFETLSGTVDPTGWETLTVSGRAGYPAENFLGSEIRCFHVMKGASSLDPSGNRIAVGTEFGVTVIDEWRGREQDNRFISFGRRDDSVSGADYTVLSGFSPEVLELSGTRGELAVILRGGLSEYEQPPVLNLVDLSSNRILASVSSETLKGLAFDPAELSEIRYSEIDAEALFTCLQADDTFVASRLKMEMIRRNVYQEVMTLLENYGYLPADNVLSIFEHSILTAVNDMMRDPEFYLENQDQFSLPPGGEAERLFDELIDGGVFYYDDDQQLVAKENLDIGEENRVIDFTAALFHENPGLPQIIIHPREIQPAKRYDLFSLVPGETVLTTWDALSVLRFDEDDTWQPIASLDDSLQTESFRGTWNWDISTLPSTDRAKIRMRGYDGQAYTDYFYSEGLFVLQSPFVPEGTISTASDHTDPYIELELSNNFNATEVIIGEDPSFQRASWREFTENVTFVTSYDRGTITLYARFRNDRGLESGIVSTSFTLDSNAVEIAHFLLADKDTGDLVRTDEPEVKAYLDMSRTADVAEMIVAENDGFEGASWQAYQNEFYYTFAEPEETKTLYVKVRTAEGAESAVRSCSIEYETTQTAQPGLPDLSDVKTAISPDGTVKAYIADYSGYFHYPNWVSADNFEIRLEYVSGSGSPTRNAQLHLLLGLSPSDDLDAYRIRSLAWAPDGGKLFFIVHAPDGDRLWSLDVDALTASNEKEWYAGVPNEMLSGIFPEENMEYVETYGSIDGGNFIKLPIEFTGAPNNHLTYEAQIRGRSIRVEEKRKNWIFETGPVPVIEENAFMIEPASGGAIDSLAWDKSDEWLYFIVNDAGATAVKAIRADGSGNEEVLYTASEGERIGNIEIGRDGSRLVFESSLEGEEWIQKELVADKGGILPACGFYYPLPYVFSSNIVLSDGSLSFPYQVFEMGNVFSGDSLAILGTAGPNLDPETGVVREGFVSYTLEYREFSDEDWTVLNHCETPVEKGVLGVLPLDPASVRSLDNIGAYEFRLTVAGENETAVQTVHSRFAFDEHVPEAPQGYALLGTGDSFSFYDGMDMVSVNRAYFADFPERDYSSPYLLVMDPVHYTVEFDYNTFEYVTRIIETEWIDTERSLTGTPEVSFQGDPFGEPYEEDAGVHYYAPRSFVEIPFPAVEEGEKIILYSIHKKGTGDYVYYYPEWADLPADIPVQGQIFFELDSQPPQVHSLEIREGSPVNTRELTIDSGVTGAVEMYVWVLHDTPPGWVPFDPEYPLVLPDRDGEATVVVRFRDAAGNETEWYFLHATLDREPPLEATIAIAEGGAVGTRNVTLVLSALDADRYRVSESADFDGVSWSAFEPPLSQPFSLSPDDGPKTVYAQFRDAAGNVSPTVNAKTFLTRVPVEESFSIEEGGWTRDLLIHLLPVSNTAVTLWVSEESDFGVKTVLPFSARVPFSLSGGDGVKAVYVKFIDAAGNETAFSGNTVELDTIAPILELDHPVQGSTLTGEGS